MNRDGIKTQMVVELDKGRLMCGFAMDTCLVDQQKIVEDNERTEGTEKERVVAAPANGRNERKKIWQKVKF